LMGGNENHPATTIASRFGPKTASIVRKFVFDDDARRRRAIFDEEKQAFQSRQKLLPARDIRSKREANRNRNFCGRLRPCLNGMRRFAFEPGDPPGAPVL